MGSVTVGVCACILQVTSGLAFDGVPSALIDAEVRAVEVDSAGALWVGVRDRGLARVADGEVEWFNTDALPQGVADLVELGGRLWATGLGGASRLDESGWTRVALPTSPRVIFSVFGEGSSGVLWFGTNLGAARYTADGWATFTVSDGLPHAVVHQVLPDGNGGVWFLCRSGLARLTNGTLEVTHRELNFRSGVIGPEGLPWLGTSGGLLRWTGSDFVVELAGVTPYPRLVASDGTVWAGSSSAGVLRHDGQGWESVVPELEGHEVFDVAEGPDGVIWVASALGLRRVDLGGL